MHDPRDQAMAVHSVLTAARELSAELGFSPAWEELANAPADPASEDAPRFSR
jgi:hypothetical protein